MSDRDKGLRAADDEIPPTTHLYSEPKRRAHTCTTISPDPIYNPEDEALLLFFLFFSFQVLVFDDFCFFFSCLGI